MTGPVRKDIRGRKAAAPPGRRRFVRAATFAIVAVMLVVHVHVHVVPDQVEAFRAATVANARESVREPGIARFDVLQQEGDPTRFILVEVYRDEAAPARHKETAHYQLWRDTVAPMMASPRTSVRLANVFPADDAW
nr:antibiotic biosynthesis monooxygenase [Nannocystis radixulma]